MKVLSKFLNSGALWFVLSTFLSENLTYELLPGMLNSGGDPCCQGLTCLLIEGLLDWARLLVNPTMS